MKRDRVNGYGVVTQDVILPEIYLNQAMYERTIWFVDEFDRDTCYKAIYFLERIEKLDDKADVPMDERKPITIKIDSYGGACYHCLGLISTIERMQERGYIINTEVFGVAMSCGFMLFIVGSNRKIARHGYIMCHALSSWTTGQLQTMNEEMKHSNLLWEKMESIIIKRTKITKSDLDDMKERKLDWYMDATESIKFGCADKIL